MCDNPAAFFLIANSFKTQEMCIKGVQVDPWQMKDVPDHFKTQEMCNKAVVCSPYELRFVPDWFVTQQQIGLRDDDNDYYDNDEIIKWCKVYKQRKAQKAKIEGELVRIAWHPLRWWDWCMSENEKKRLKNCGSNKELFSVQKKWYAEPKNVLIK